MIRLNGMGLHEELSLTPFIQPVHYCTLLLMLLLMNVLLITLVILQPELLFCLGWVSLVWSCISALHEMQNLPSNR